jgi:hypothetical protein
MTDRDRGNTDVPRLVEDEGCDYSGTRRVGAARRDHEADRHRRESELGTS